MLVVNFLWQQIFFQAANTLTTQPLQEHTTDKNQCPSCEMCTIHAQQNIKLQQQLLKASQKITRLEKELKKVNERWSDTFRICNASVSKGMYRPFAHDVTLGI